MLFGKHFSQEHLNSCGCFVFHSHVQKQCVIEACHFSVITGIVKCLFEVIPDNVSFCRLARDPIYQCCSLCVTHVQGQSMRKYRL